MLNFKAKLEEEYRSAYKTAYDLPLKQQFSNPKIYTAKGDLSKRWYVYFSYRDPVTGKLKRQTPLYSKGQHHKTNETRYALLTLYRTRLLKLLKEGYDPNVDNTDFHYHKTKTNVSRTKTDVQNTTVPKKEKAVRDAKPNPIAETTLQPRQP